MIIYCITNLLNGKKYIGQTTKSMAERFRRHCWASEHVKNMPICLAIFKYGKENFTIEEICRCTTQEELDAAEIRYALEMNTFSPNGYNLKAGSGTGSMSEETKRKISLANMGKKVSDETRKKSSISHIGHVVSAETRKKLSVHNKGKRGSDLCYKRVSEVNQKTYTFFDPNGNKVTFTNLKRFCAENNLKCVGMCKVYKGIGTSHKGWVKYDPDRTYDEVRDQAKLRLSEARSKTALRTLSKRYNKDLT